MKMSIDGNTGTSLSFASSGAWCFNNGVPVVKTVQVELTAGVHTIKFQPNSGDAPFLDKIDLVATTSPDAPLNAESLLVETTTTIRQMQVEGKVYPNPATPGTLLHVPSFNRTKTATITLYDLRGAAIKRSMQKVSDGYTMPYVSPGIYMLRVEESGSIKTYRILVQ
jgi:hypothetical protein